MSDLSDLLANEAIESIPQRWAKPPKGWEAGVAYSPGGDMTVTTAGVAEAVHGDPAAWHRLVEDLGLHVPDGWRIRLVEAKYDPAAWTRDHTSQDKAVTRAVWRYRFAVEQDPWHGPDADLDGLLKEIKRFKPPAANIPPALDNPDSFVVALADWQFGQADAGGSEITVQRVLESVAGVERRVKELRRLGRPLGTLYVLTLGDLIEGCDDHYAMQTFSVDLDRREQVKVVRRLLVKALTRWAKLFDRVVVAGVAGNHGENRKEGKAFTTFGDNDDVAVLEQVSEVLAGNPDAFGHVSFVIPDQELTLALDVSGTVIGLSHGHQAGSGATVQKKLWEWWEGQSMGRAPVGDADILLTGHYHHLVVNQPFAGRCHIQAPPLCGDSQWWVERTGQTSLAGTLTFSVGPDGWSDLQIV